MKSGVSGLIRPYSSSLGFLHRLLDIFIVVATLWLCALLYSADFNQYLWLAVAWAIAFFIFFAEARGVYHSWRINSFQDESVAIIFTWLSVIASLIVFAFLTKISEKLSRVVIVAWAISTPIYLLLLRIALRQFLHKLRSVGRNTRTLAIVGCGNMANRVAEIIQASPWMGIKIIGAYDVAHACKAAPAGIELVGTTENLVPDVKAGKVDFVYITLPIHEEQHTLTLLNELADTTASVYVVPDSYIHNLVHARWFTLNGLPVVSVFESPFYGVDGWLKRTEDMLLGFFILLLISPLLLLIGLAITLTSAGPIIFKQRRYGLNGEIIAVWKFRSMSVCEDGPDIPQARRSDPRVTKLGAFLRRTSLDELPQFINVLQGRMSIVGPRPHAVAHNEQYRKLVYGYMLRHKVKPGITGWAQINGWRGETDTLDKMEMRVKYDLEYISNWSLGLDIKIIFLTILKGFSGKSAF